MAEDKSPIDELDNESDDEDEEAEAENNEPDFGSYDDEENQMPEETKKDETQKPAPAPATLPQARPARRGGGLLGGMRQPAAPLQSPVPAKTSVGLGAPPVETKPEPEPKPKPEELVLKIQQTEFETFAKDEPSYKPEVLLRLGGFNGIAIGITRLASKAKTEGQKPSQAYMMAVRALLGDVYGSSRLGREQLDQIKLVAWYVISTLFVALGAKPEMARAESLKCLEAILAAKQAETDNQDRNAMNGPPPMPKAEEAPKPEPKPAPAPKAESKPEAKPVEKPVAKPVEKPVAETKPEPVAETKPVEGGNASPSKKPNAALAPTVEAPTPAPVSRIVPPVAKTPPPASPKTPTPKELVREKVEAEVAKGGFEPPEPPATDVPRATNPIVPANPAPARVSNPAAPPAFRPRPVSGPHPAADEAMVVQQAEMRDSPIQPKPIQSAGPKTEPISRPTEESETKQGGLITVVVVVCGFFFMVVLGMFAFHALFPATSDSASAQPSVQPVPTAPKASQVVCEKVSPQLVALHFNQSDPVHFKDPGPRQSGRPYVECRGQKVFHDTARNTFDVRRCDVCYTK